MSGDYQTIIVERDGPVETLTLNRPDSLNALTGTMVRELLDYFTSKCDDLDTRIIVMKGAGRGFCAGLDIKEHAGGGDGLPRGEGTASLTAIPPAMRACPQPVIALIHGPCCGGGFAFALAADIRIAGDSARMNDAFIRIGMSGCELGLSWQLPRLVGLSVARELMYTGRFIGAERALQVGLVSYTAPDDQLEETARPLIDDMLANSPLGLRLTKKTLDEALKVDELADVIALEGETQRQCQESGDFAEAMAAFIEKRPPNYARG